TAWYLHGDGAATEGGALDASGPGDEPPDGYAYDPADPVAWTVGTNPWTFGLNIGDRRPIEARADVLVYTSAPFARPVEIVGDLRARLHVATDAEPRAQVADDLDRSEEHTSELQSRRDLV